MTTWEVSVRISPRPSPGVILDRLSVEVDALDPDSALSAAEEAVRLRWPGFELVAAPRCRAIRHNDELQPHEGNKR